MGKKKRQQTFRLSNDCKLFKYICPCNKNTVSVVCFLPALCLGRGRQEEQWLLTGRKPEEQAATLGFGGSPCPGALSPGRVVRMTAVAGGWLWSEAQLCWFPTLQEFLAVVQGCSSPGLLLGPALGSRSSGCSPWHGAAQVREEGAGSSQHCSPIPTALGSWRGFFFPPLPDEPKLWSMQTVLRPLQQPEAALSLYFCVCILQRCKTRVLLAQLQHEA